MDSYEATKVVFSRIRSLDPDNASKIMGYLLLQDHGDKDMIRLAFGPETLLLSLMSQAKTQLGILPSSSNSPSSAPSSPFNRPNPLSIPSASRFSNAFDITNPSSPSSTSWPHLSPHTNSTPSSLSYATIVNGGTNNCNNSSSNDLTDEYQLHHDHFAFLNESKNDDFLDPRLEMSMSPTGYGGDNTNLLHRRSFSVPGMCFGPEDADSGLGWKPCLYYASGFCKNGSGCKFVHGGESGDGCSPIVGSPNKFNEFEQCQELLRSKAMAQQQQKLAAASQFMAGTSFPYNKCMNFLLQQQNDSPRSAAVAALMMEDDFHKFGRCRSGRNDFYSLGLGGAMSPGSRQIYLTFPADSVFREEDVSNYFSIYGPVQDVRIPYQQKRMFGFVTFLYSETVKLILAKGNPHFVCDSRVLVKPYKEKGKILDKKQQLLMERGEFSACSSPSGIDSREPFDLHLGSQMYYNAQEMLLRRRMEEQDNLQQAIELQERRIMNLQLLDLKSQGHHHLHHHQYLHNLSNGSPIPSPTLAHTPKNHSFDLPPNGVGQELPEENGGDPDAAKDSELEKDLSTTTCNYNNGNGNGSCEGKPNSEESDPNESLEHIFPDNLFASPEKSTGGHNLTAFSTSSVEFDGIASNPVVSSSSNNTTLIPTNSSLTMSTSTVKSCFLQMPRLSSGHGAIGM